MTVYFIKRKVVVASVLCAGVFSVCAQTNQTLDAKSGDMPSMSNTNSEPPDYHPITVAAEVGTTGVGANLGWRFSGLLGIHAGADYFKYSGSQKIQDLTYNISVEPLSETVALDLYPWSRHSFRVSLGLMIDQTDISGRIAGGYVLNGKFYNGVLDLSLRPQPVNPYVSIGGNLFYFDHAHHWAMFGELGLAYVGTARVTLTGSDPTAAFAISNEKHKIEDSWNGFPFWPILKLGINYSF